MTAGADRLSARLAFREQCHRAATRLEHHDPLTPAEREVITPPPVIDLIAALKRSLAQEMPRTDAASAKEFSVGFGNVEL